MTRKHFEALAKALAAVRPIYEDGGNVWEDCIKRVADVCAMANAAEFDRERFQNVAYGWED